MFRAEDQGTNSVATNLRNAEDYEAERCLIPGHTTFLQAQMPYFACEQSTFSRRMTHSTESKRPIG